MQSFVALIKGINVGGKNIIPMKDLKMIFQKLGLQNVMTYIQSGNVIFQSSNINLSELNGQITDEIKKSFGIEVQTFLLTKVEFKIAIEANPFPKADKSPKSLHLYFLDRKPHNPNKTLMLDVKKEGEDFKLIDNVCYFYAPEGIGKSKLASKVEKLLGVSATARNWRTVNEIFMLLNKLYNS